MRHTSLASFAALPLAAVLAVSAPAQTGSSTQVVPFDYDPFIDAAFPEIELFDTMGGTRELNSVTLSYDQTISFDVRLEQNSPVALEAGNFFADITYLSIHQLGTGDGGGEGEGEGRGIPFLGPGAAGTQYSPALAATDGFNGAGPDSFSASFNSGEFNFTSIADQNDGASVLQALTGQGSLTTVLGGFTEIFGGYNGDPMFPEVDPNNPPEGPFFPFQDPFYGVFVDTFNIRHQGTISVTYDFTIVPAPASVALLGFAGTVAARRRR
ncbi:MAG: hypothetical protein AAFR96_04155 [Planctomycetota bacterium]